MGHINIGPDGNNAIPTYSGTDPTITGVYLHGIVDVAGTVAANNYYSLFNPGTSTKTVIVVGVTLNNYSTNTVTGAVSLKVFRTSAHSGGTDVTAPNINRFLTTFPDPQAQVKVGNPAATTVGNALIGFPPALGSGAQAPASASPTPGASFVLLPGQGVVFSVSAGSTNQLWNIQVIWIEK